ncbi:hypothetical protein [Spiroplasma turonicum]|uniref:Transmembrane protein n=1 Tax=Spiroplasma turonicum TaxID=216946 RepID=A0A0K1P662_9MOLU|nr:hypothetical protein [Spiroplasma turonicum]AKU79407.1 hypothetical protein STURON_00161 [Spiroplasma turonicum]ALX70428.1 hypothetical protein STURO_v1c01590 [Spiroplasma turonicum]
MKNNKKLIIKRTLIFLLILTLSALTHAQVSFLNIFFKILIFSSLFILYLFIRIKFWKIIIQKHRIIKDIYTQNSNLKLPKDIFYLWINIFFFVVLSINNYEKNSIYFELKLLVLGFTIFWYILIELSYLKNITLLCVFDNMWKIILNLVCLSIFKIVKHIRKLSLETAHKIILMINYFKFRNICKNSAIVHKLKNTLLLKINLISFGDNFN